MGYNRDDFAGVLLSLDCTSESNKKTEAYAKSNRSKQTGRQAKAPKRRSRKR